MSYPSIVDHGLIGDLQTAALIATDGNIDGLLPPAGVHPPRADRRRGPPRPPAGPPAAVVDPASRYGGPWLKP